jgi:ABC-2 type transport system ATP-binding protein
MVPIVELAGLGKRHEGFALSDISFDVARGCITGVFGPSGAGKTTLMKLIAGQTLPATGTVRVFGLAYTDAESQIKNRIGYLPEEPPFPEDDTVAATAAFVSRFFKRWDEARFGTLLQEFGISRTKKVKELSRGRKTLLSLAVALSHGADLLILDEPTGGIDMILRRRIRELLRDFVGDEEKSVIVSSHATEGLDDVCDYVIFIHDGKLVLRAERDELLSAWKWIHFRNGALPENLLETFACVELHELGSRALTSDIAAIRDHLDDGLATGDIRLVNATLDDILIHLVEGG